MEVLDCIGPIEAQRALSEINERIQVLNSTALDVMEQEGVETARSLLAGIKHILDVSTLTARETNELSRAYKNVMEVVRDFRLPIAADETKQGYGSLVKRIRG